MFRTIIFGLLPDRVLEDYLETVTGLSLQYHGMAIKLIIFDLDGTLVDSSADIAGALNTALGPFGIPSVPKKEVEGIIGGGFKELIGRFLEKRKIDLDRQALFQSFFDIYSAHLTDYTRPYPRARETLEALNHTEKAIISNKMTSFVVEILKRFDLDPFFISVQGADMLIENKPAPTSILALLSRFSVKRDEAVIVGDSIYDIEAGRRAGIYTVAALYGYGAPGFDRDASFAIPSLQELPEVIRKLNEHPS